MQTDSETWLVVPGYDGTYEVSDLGRVRSWQPWRGQAVPRILKPKPGAAGRYLSLGLYRNGVKDEWAVHRLVLLTFVGPLPEGLHSRHLDGDAVNNRLSNLEYSSVRENLLDVVRMGRHPVANRTHCKNDHEYTPENTTTKENRRGRVCVTCQRTWAAEAKSRARAALRRPSALVR